MKLQVLALFSMLCAPAGVVYASCHGNGMTLPFRPAVNITGATPINVDVPNGAVIAYLYYAANPGGLLSCTSSIGRMTITQSGTPLGLNLYSTNVPGIAYRYPGGDWNYPAASHFMDNPAGTISLIKTGPINSSATISGMELIYTVHNHSPYVVHRMTFAPFPLTLPRPTCRLTTTSPSVDFKAIPIGTTHSELALGTFYVSGQCSGGAVGQTIPVRITFTDAHAPGNRGQDLTTVPANSGMTINLASGTHQISFGPASSAAGNPGQFQLGTMNNGWFNYPINARLMRTGAMRPLASFSAQATMTMRYE